MTKLTTLIALLALAMLVIVPASAVWHNGNWLTDEEYSELTDGTNVIYNPQSDVGSKYKAVDNGQNDYQYSCDLRGSIRAHVNTLSPEVLISNDLAPEKTTKLKVLSDGTFSYPPYGEAGGLAYGTYTLTLLGEAGNGGQTETAKVVCGAPGGVVYPQRELLGHAVSAGDGENVCVPSYTIESAKYGLAQPTCHDVTVHRGAYVKVEEIPDMYVDVGKNHGDYEYCSWGGFYYYVGHNNGNFDKVNGVPEHYDFVGQGNGDYVKHRCCNYRYVEPTITCVPDGTFEDVTSNVQQVVATGHTSVLFDNRPCVGGIFAPDGFTPLSEIEDPAPGIVKDVIITYQNGCGLDKTITTKEYCTIDLVAGTATCPSQGS